MGRRTLAVLTRLVVEPPIERMLSTQPPTDERVERLAERATESALRNEGSTTYRNRVIEGEGSRPVP